MMSWEKKIVNLWQYSPLQISKGTKLFAKWYFLVVAILCRIEDPRLIYSRLLDFKILDCVPQNAGPQALKMQVAYIPV